MGVWEEEIPRYRSELSCLLAQRWKKNHGLYVQCLLAHLKNH